MPIRLEDRLGSVSEVMELAELMRDVRKHKGDRTADRFLPIGDDASHRNWKPVFDLPQQSGEVPLGTTE